MDRQRYVCVAKCYFMLRRWKPGQVFDFIEGQLDVPTGQRLRRPGDVGLKDYFQEVPLDFVAQPEAKATAFKIRRKRVVGVATTPAPTAPGAAPAPAPAPTAPGAAPAPAPAPTAPAQATKGGRNG